MNTNVIPKFLSWGSLALVLFPCLLSFAGLLGLDVVKWLALAGTAGWFASTPFWMGQTKTAHADSAAI